MIDPMAVFHDEELGGLFDFETLVRATEYVRRGKVVDVSHRADDEGDIEIRGLVDGSGGAPYAAFVSAGIDHGDPWAFSTCSCPVRSQCKHGLALLITVRDAILRAAGSEPSTRHWERQLDAIIDELDDSSAAVDYIPLALQLELGKPAHARWTPNGERVRGPLRMRPMQRGSRGNWIRSGISWQQVAYLTSSRTYPPDQLAVLAEMFAAYQASSRRTYVGGDTHLMVANFSESLWALLERMHAAHIPLVLGDGLASVKIKREPVEVEFDVAAGADETALLAIGLWCDGAWYGSGEMTLVGDAGHGVALWAADDAGRSWHLTLARLVKPASPAVRRMIAMGSPIQIPPSDRGDLVADYLPRLQRHVPVKSADKSVVVPELVRPRLALTVNWIAVDEVRIEWSWRYRVGADDRVYALDDARGLRGGVRRPEVEGELLGGLDLDEEQIHHLCEGHQRVHGLRARQTFTGQHAIVFATDLLPGLESAGQIEIDEIGGRPNFREASTAPVVHFAARSEPPDPDAPLHERTDWLDLEVIITVDGHPLAFAHLLHALTVGEERLILDSGVHITLDRPEFKHLAELVAAAAELHPQPEDRVRVSHHDLGLWDELAEVGVVDEQARSWVEAAKALRDLKTLPDVEPIGVEAQLRHYQRDGFRWLAFLWRAGLGGILGDDMGLGKTLQTLALVAHARSEGSGPFLVIAPTSVVSTWVHEAATFTPGLTVRAITESSAKRHTTFAEAVEGADVVVTSYTLYRLEVDSYVARDWGGLVLDEAQTVKNHLAKTYQCVRRLDAPFRLALTGTPMENRLMELWSLLSIVAPGLYPYPGRFAELVSIPVEKLGDLDALERFRRRIRPFLLRRTKELVEADLPAKQEQVLDVQLTPKHRRIYDTHLQRERQNVLGLVDEFDKHRIAIFRSLTKLRQLSLDAALVDDQYEGIGSAKIDVLVDQLSEVVAEGHRALVFSQFTSFLSRVRSRLDDEAITSTYLDGSTRRRADVITEFKTGEAAVFLISLKAGGVGLTLTEADYVFVLDPWWNPAVEAQAVDRAHRIGQRRPVMVYRLVASNTIEQKVMELKARKAALFSKVLDGDGSMATPIDATDVRALFDP